MPRMTAVMSEGVALLRTTFQVVCQRVHPRAYDPSRYWLGTARRASIESVVIVGRIMMASTRAPERMPAPVGAASPKIAFTSELIT